MEPDAPARVFQSSFVGAAGFNPLSPVSVIVADVVAEWADRHGKDFTLTLTGPAGGSWKNGENGPVLTLDAVDFCRALSSRTVSVTLDDLMNTEVPY